MASDGGNKSTDKITHTAFFYGTLMAPGVLHRVIYGDSLAATKIPASQLPQIRSALLSGYRRSRVKGAEYPAIRPHVGSDVRGSLVTGLTDADVRCLDVFEGPMYQRVKVKVKVLEGVGLEDKADESARGEVNGADGGGQVEEEVEAETYVWETRLKHLLEEGEWDFEEFKKEKMRFWMGEGFSDDDEEQNGDVEVDDGFADVDAAAEREGWERDPMGGRGANGAITRQLDASRKG